MAWGGRSSPAVVAEDQGLAHLQSWGESTFGSLCTLCCRLASRSREDHPPGCAQGTPVLVWRSFYSLLERLHNQLLPLCTGRWRQKPLFATGPSGA